MSEIDNSLRITDLSFRFKNNQDNLFENLSLTVPEGNCTVIGGSNGSGKSTLLKLIAGMIPRQKIGELTGNIECTQNISIVFQKPNTQILTFRVDEEIVTPLSFRGESRSDRTAFIEKNRSDLGDLLNKDPRKISAGEQQKVVITAAIATNSEILLLDEPLSFLDDDNANTVLEYLKKINEGGTTLVITTHQIQKFMEMIDDYYLISNKKLQQINDITVSTPRQKLIQEEEFTPAYRINGVIGWPKGFTREVDSGFSKTGLFAIHGANGSGKTTLLLSLANIIEMISGDIDFPENSIFIPHNAYQFFWRSTVREELQDIIIPKWISPYLNFSPFELSTGYQKLLSVYLGIKGKDIVLIDEPSKSLDEELLSLLMKMMRRNKSNKLIIFASNDKNLLSRISSDLTGIIGLT